MYHPESEDLLPRSAPKPSANITTANSAKPTVPEVSILFNQDLPQTQSNQLQTNKTETYASWKKQRLPLPQVAYSYQKDNMNMAIDSPSQVKRSTVYPMRVHPSQTLNTVASGTNINNNLVAPNDSNDIHARRNSGGYYQSTDINEVFVMRNNNNIAAVSNLTTKTSAPPVNTNHFVYNSPNFNINNPETSSQMKNLTNDVLTICAGTQTQNVSTTENLSTLNIATKDDINNIMIFLQDIRNEQIRMFQEMTVSQKRTVILKDTAIQCDILATNVRLFEEELTDEKSYRDHRLNVFSTSGNTSNDPSSVSSPVPNQRQRRNNYAVTPRSNVLPVLPKPSTEKSMVMNELALKYLPCDKLSEILHEIRLGDNNSSPPTPLIGDNGHTSKGPSDMSNASYKYLKKYRLLPEENNNKQQNEHLHNNLRYNLQDNMIGDLEDLKRHPKFL